MKDDPGLRDILDRAAELPADQRPAFLDAACSGHAELRAEVESLLLALDDAEEFLVSPTIVGGAASVGDVSDKIPESIGAYKLIERLGEGGMGVVYLAEQERPVRRHVALKIIKPGMDSAAIIARFEAERQALALMDHSNIARVYDAGTTANGRPYFVMELVQGVSVTRYCDENRLTPEQRLELFIPICQAVQHAHQKGIVHRDLKPGNILVTLQDGKPLAKVIDFGIAKALHQRLTEETLFTQMGILVGTPEYMSPEQAGANPDETDTRSDIYALGVILYELLTGTTPLERRQLLAAGYEQMMRTIREMEPPKPSTRLSGAGDGVASASALRQMEPRKLAKLMIGDLDVIVMKCLEKDRSRRYETANGLARDIERYLNDEPVEARPPSSAYILGRFAWKYRKAVSVAIAFTVLAAGFLTTTSVVFWVLKTQASHQRDIAVSAKSAADAARLAETAAKDEAVKQKQAAEAARAKAETEAYIASLFAAAAALGSDNFSDANQMLNAAPQNLRNWEWNYLHAKSNPQLRTFPFFGAQFGIGNEIEMIRSDFSIHFYDVGSGLETNSFPTPPAPQNHPLTISLDGTRILSVNTESLWATEGMSPVILRLGTSERVPLKIAHPKVQNERMLYYYTSRFTPDNSRLITTSWDGSVRVWDTSTGEEQFNLAGHKGLVISTNLSRDGSTLVTGDILGVSKVWDLKSRVCLATYRAPDPQWIFSALSPDCKRVVSTFAETDRQGVIWNLDSGGRDGVGKILTLKEGVHTNYNLCADFSPDGKRVVIGGGMFATVLDADTGNLVNVLRGHRERICGVQFNHDGTQIMTSSNDGTQRLWTTEPPPVLVFGSGTSPILDAAFCSDSNSIVTQSADGVARVHELVTAKTLVTVDTAGFIAAGFKPNAAVPYDPTATHIAVPAKDGTVFICDAATGAAVRRVGDAIPGASPVVTALSPDGLLAITGSSNGTVRVWDLKTAQAVATLQLLGNAIQQIVVSPGNDCVAICDGGNAAQLWDIRPGTLRNAGMEKLIRVFQHRDAINSLAFNHDGTRLVTASKDATAIVWDAALPAASSKKTAAVSIARMNVHHSSVLSAAFSPDNSKIVLACIDDIAEVWQISSAKQIGLLRGHQGSVLDAVYSPDGTRVITSSKDGTARIWDPDSSRELLVLNGHTGPVRKAVFSPDGSKVLTVSDDGMARVWDSVSAEQRTRSVLNLDNRDTSKP